MLLSFTFVVCPFDEGSFSKTTLSMVVVAKVVFVVVKVFIFTSCFACVERS